jgi:hypothetical protein
VPVCRCAWDPAAGDRIILARSMTDYLRCAHPYMAHHSRVGAETVASGL